MGVLGIAATVSRLLLSFATESVELYTLLARTELTVGLIVACIPALHVLTTKTTVTAGNGLPSGIFASGTLEGGFSRPASRGAHATTTATTILQHQQLLPPLNLTKFHLPRHHPHHISTNSAGQSSLNQHLLHNSSQRTSRSNLYSPSMTHTPTAYASPLHSPASPWPAAATATNHSANHLLPASAPSPATPSPPARSLSSTTTLLPPPITTATPPPPPSPSLFHLPRRQRQHQHHHHHDPPTQTPPPFAPTSPLPPLGADDLDAADAPASIEDMYFGSADVSTADLAAMDGFYRFLMSDDDEEEGEAEDEGQGYAVGGGGRYGSVGVGEGGSMGRSAEGDEERWF